MGLSREQRLWLVAAGLLLSYFVLTFVGQSLLERLQAIELLEEAVLLVLVAAAAAVVVWAIRRRLDLRQLAALGAFGAVLAWILTSIEFQQERLHFVQYGLLGGVADAALRERWGRPAVDASRRALIGPLAALVAGAGGWADEAIQAWLPYRVYDIRDVGFNALAGALVVVALGTVRLLDRR